MRQYAPSSLSQMFAQSAQVLSRPSVANFERFERAGNVQNALIYVGIAAAVAGVLHLSFGGLFGLIGFALATLVSFFVFTGVVYFIGQAMGGTGTYPEIAYTFALFWVPLSIVGSVLGLIPFLGALAGIAVFVGYCYFGWLAVQSAHNIRDTGKAAIVLIASGVIAFVVNMVINLVVLAPAFIANFMSN